MTEKAKLTKSELEILNKFVGFGNFAKTDILFWGIEEGAGPTPKYENEAQRHRVEVVLRVKYIPENTSSTYFFNGQKNIDGGYWSSGRDTDKMRQQCYNDLGYRYDYNEQSLRSTWGFPARVMLALEEHNSQDMDKWFKYKNISAKNKDVLSKEQEKIIDERMSTGLYGRETGIRINLTDWRPICRKDMTDTKYWPYNDDVNQEQYFAAFDFKIKLNRKPIEPYYQELCETRLKIYKNIFDKHYIPVIFCFGLKGIRENLIKGINDGKEIVMNKVTFPNSVRTYYHGIIEFKKGKTLILFTNHFSNGRMSLQDLNLITKQIRNFLDSQKK